MQESRLSIDTRTTTERKLGIDTTVGDTVSIDACLGRTTDLPTGATMQRIGLWIDAYAIAKQLTNGTLAFAFDTSESSRTGSPTYTAIADVCIQIDTTT
jgi:hypothetical protein